MISAREALERLREENRRFACGVRSTDMLASQTRRSELAAGQEPFAIILGCSDSRVPAEIVFDQGATELRHDSEALVRQAVRSNVRASANHLRHGSEVLEPRIQGGALLVVGAEYSLESGVVDFFDGLPEAG